MVRFVEILGFKSKKCKKNRPNHRYPTFVKSWKLNANLRKKTVCLSMKCADYLQFRSIRKLFRVASSEAIDKVWQF